MKKITSIICICFFILSSNAQIQDSLRDDLVLKMSSADLSKLRIADNYFKNLEYLMALPIYENLYEKYNNDYLSYLFGSCCVFESHYSYKAEELILRASSLKKLLPDYYFYYGKSLIENEKYELAKEQFNNYLKLPIPLDIKEYIYLQLDVCENNINMKGKATPVKIKNIGPNVNTIENEYSPVFPANNAFMLYTYRGEKSVGEKQLAKGKKNDKGIYFEDIYISYKDSLGNFKPGEPLKELNTNSHESVSYVSQDGLTIYLYKNLTGRGDIFKSKKQANGMWSKPEALKGICTSYWEGSCCFSADEHTIYFSSDRPGGMGGRDIWKSNILPNGSFDKPVNVGAPINTSSDEDSPFISSDGKLFFFSSNDGKKSIGGYDIFKSEIKNNEFTQPQNIGKPLNTTRDDKFLVISPDGKKAYYSSDHFEGYGQQDIYEIDRVNFEKTVSLIYVHGTVQYNGTPVKASITATSLINKNYYNGEYNTEMPTGKYFLSLPGKSSYELIIKYGKIKVTKLISSPLIDSVVDLELNIDLNDSDTLENYSALKAIDTLDTSSEISLVEFMKSNGNKIFENTKFMVQIAAYKVSKNFNYANLIGFPALKKIVSSDGITRFVLGEFNTINEAEDLLIRVQKLIAKDAFIIALQNNKRILLHDLMKQTK